MFILKGWENSVSSSSFGTGQASAQDFEIWLNCVRMRVKCDAESAIQYSDFLTSALFIEAFCGKFFGQIHLKIYADYIPMDFNIVQKRA